MLRREAAVSEPQDAGSVGETGWRSRTSVALALGSGMLGLLAGISIGMGVGGPTPAATVIATSQGHKPIVYLASPLGFSEATRVSTGIR